MKTVALFTVVFIAIYFGSDYYQSLPEEKREKLQQETFKILAVACLSVAVCMIIAVCNFIMFG